MNASDVHDAGQPVLLVAATERELVRVSGAHTLCCGIGPIEAAIATTNALHRQSYAVVVHVGIAGARTLQPGSVVIGSSSVYADVLAPQTTLPRIAHLVTDAILLAAMSEAVPGAVVLPIATSGRVGGSGVEHEIEAMEGFGVLRAAAVAGVPAVEVRVISNLVQETDRRQWRIREALEILHETLPLLVDAAQVVARRSAPAD